MAGTTNPNSRFTYSKMLPAADEQLDALWADNLADNTGFLFFRKFPGPTITFRAGTPVGGAPAAFTGTYWFEKQPGMGSFHGSLSGSLANITHGHFSLAMNGTSIFSIGQTFIAPGTMFQRGIGTSLEGIADGAMVPLTYTGTVDGPGFTLAHLTTWQTP